MIKQAPKLIVLTALLLSACAVTQPYQRPSVDVPANYKAAEGWKTATPSDHVDRGAWWAMLGDPVLNGLEDRINISNQTVAAAEAAYRQSRAIVREQRASLFPVVDLSGSAVRSGGGGATTASQYRVGIGATWEPDLWGRIRQTVSAANASAQASAADLASARLSVQGELAINYLGLRQADAEIALLRTTVAGYQRSVEITNNRYTVGVAPHSDALQAQTQLANAQADLAGLEQNRTTYENAIAVLVGQSAGNFRLAAVADWSAQLPVIPATLPSTLLESRPDIAGAERRVAAANATVGVNQAAFFPTIGLSASGDSASTRLGNLLSSSTNAWSIGLSVAQTLFDAGARKARVEQARAAYDAAVADYRQTVLTAFADVENQMTATQVLERQYVLRQTASNAADQTEQMLLNQYRAGQIAYTDVVTAQAAALSSRRTLLAARVARQTAAVALIQALGQGWSPTPAV